MRTEKKRPASRGSGGPTKRIGEVAEAETLPVKNIAPAGGANQSAQVLAAASRYIKRGWKLLPTDITTKEPLGGLGLKHATNNITKIERWLERWPDLALAGTPPPGTTVVDIDSYKDHDKLDQLVDELRDLDGPVQRTQSGGFHFLVSGTVPPARELRQHFGTKYIDVKPHGKGYVLLAPMRATGGSGRTQRRLRSCRLRGSMGKTPHHRSASSKASRLSTYHNNGTRSKRAK